MYNEYNQLKTWSVLYCALINAAFNRRYASQNIVEIWLGTSLWREWVQALANDFKEREIVAARVFKPPNNYIDAEKQETLIEGSKEKREHEKIGNDRDRYSDAGRAAERVYTEICTWAGLFVNCMRRQQRK